MKKEGKFISTNPEKATARVTINGVMLASIFVMLGVVFVDLDKFHSAGLWQMVLSIPFLFISSLAYTKVGYWKETKFWDLLGYITNTFGNLFLINAVGLFAFVVSPTLSFLYFGLMISLFLIFSAINIYHGKPFKIQLIKFLLSATIIFFGGIFQLI